ncbi:MAG: hypothetical protein HY225_03960 [Candidatus Vogelbacteria bacterium]|nr:hypothetical protein [Candidatus Vogelbacteria bacterium]
MALSDKEILRHMELGNILIDPFREDNLATSSYDVSLGEYYFREQKPNDDMRIYNVYSKKHTERVWGTEPSKAKRAIDILKGIELEGIADDDKIILIGPGETILAHTIEFIGGQNTVTTMMKARSSLGRSFIEVCKCAGWGDVGYTNRWTMEVTNNSGHYAIPLVVGRRIAQIIFFDVGPILKNDYRKIGKYHNTTDFEQTKKEWEPMMMLPRLYKDRDIKK